MEAKKRKHPLSVSLVLLLIMVPFIVVLTAGLGTTLAVQSIATQKAMISDKTIEMATTAAELIKPYRDEVGSLQAEDEGTPTYQAVHDILAAFRIANAGTSGELAYIYGCREKEDHTFEFTIDPSDDPAEFGEALEETYAIRQAAEGKAAFDKEPYTDRWGSFYSAYAPVFDSQNRVAMIIGIDVWANWYNESIWSHSRAIIIISSIAIISGIVLGSLIAGHISKRMRVLLNEFSDLEEDVRLLTADIKETDATPEPVKPEGDEVLALRAKIRSAQQELHDYIEYTKQAAYVDPLAHVGSRARYTERIDALDMDQPFGVLIIDINDLKYTNDTFGHDMGDTSIVSVANILKSVFVEEDIFRIGGDEMAVLFFGSEEEAKKRIEEFSDALREFNEISGLPYVLSVATGLAFLLKEDRGYSDVFRRADARMYQSKIEYHKIHKPGE